MANDAHTFSDVACTVCGCACDDLRVEVAGRRIARVHGACRLAEPWLLALNDRPPPLASLAGRAAPFEQAIERASQLLRRARNPLIFGLSRSSTRGQGAAVRLAERLGANIDTTASVGRGAYILALQEVGESTCSLGEVRNRADLVIFWGANPVESHPRHFERYSADPPGLFVPAGRSDRTLIVVDARPTATSALADLFLQVKPGRDFEAIWTLRGLISGEEPAPASETGIPIAQLRELATRMKSARYGAVFFDLRADQRDMAHPTIEGLLRLVAELNGLTRFTARELTDELTGAEKVLTWQTGYPFGVNLARGFPRYNPGEFTARELLERDETDACLLVGSESTSLLSEAARAALRRVPTIVLDYPQIRAPFDADVRFTTAVYGVHAAGTAYRMDGIPIPLRRVLDCKYPTDEAVLDALGSACGR